MEPALVDKKGLSIMIVRSVFWGIQSSITALSIKYIIDHISKQNFSSIRIRLTILGALYLAQDVPSYFFRNNQNKWRYSMRTFLYQKYYSQLFLCDNNTIEGIGTGKIQHILSTGLNSWLSTLLQICSRGTELILSLVLSLILIFNNVGTVATISTLLLLGLSYYIANIINKQLAGLRKIKRDYVTENNKSYVRMIMSKNEILQNNRISYEINHIKKHYENMIIYDKKESRTHIFRYDLQKLVISGIRIGILAYSVYGVKHGFMSIGTVSLLWMLVNQINGSILELNGFVTSFYQEKINIDQLWNLFDRTPQIKGFHDGKSFTSTQGNITLENITYNYGKGEVLENLSLTIEGGKKTALIGVSGSGKSTIIKLIAGYLYPQQGSVIVDNQELPNPNNTDYVSLSSYYKHIGYLTQEPNVFDGTIYENLTYALDYEPSEDELQKAIQGAQCQFIYEFPEGVQTQIGEKGIKLSGGQRQRLAIAKVFLKNPTIVLLDEPTSALDSFSEEEVTKAFNNLFTGRTVIIIAHRLQTVKNADRIIVLEKGNIVEEGNHRSLVLTGGVYAKMLELQSGF